MAKNKSHRVGVKRHSSISRRLIVNTLVIVASVLIALCITVAAAMHNYYYTQAGDYITNIAASYGYANIATAEEYEVQAFALAESFPMKNKVEVQFLNTADRVIVSTSGYLPVGETYRNDTADSNGDSWSGRLQTGERVMAVLADVSGANGQVIGRVRCVTSLELIDRNLMFINICVGAVSLAVIVLSIILCNVYVQSIIRPLREVGEMAHRIAEGDFKYRIELHELNEIGELCDTINYMAAELESTEDMKNEFISSVSHELRTPLTAIRGWGETVKGLVYTDHATVEKGIGIILSESQRLSGLVEELLDFSRMQSGRMTFRMEKTDVLAELGEAVCMYEELAKRAGVMLAYHEPESMPYVIGDANRLMQVFVNVIDNAVKYNHEGGLVVIDVIAADGFVHVSVNDTGSGIPAEDIDKVKQKFYKANKKVNGSGIGLAVADEIIAHHGGELKITSTEGVGTTVIVSLPIAAESESVKEETNG